MVITRYLCRCKYQHLQQALQNHWYLKRRAKMVGILLPIVRITIYCLAAASTGVLLPIGQPPKSLGLVLPRWKPYLKHLVCGCSTTVKHF